MDLIDSLSKRWEGNNNPFLIHPEGSLSFKDILENKNINLDSVKKGDVVALIGDFNSISIATLLMLIDKKVILVPLTNLTKEQHEYFFESAHVNVIIEDGKVSRFSEQINHEFLDIIRERNSSGLILFSTGTTGISFTTLHNGHILEYRSLWSEVQF